MTAAVAKEVAEQELARFLEAMDLVDKIDPKLMSEENANALAKNKAVVLRNIEEGHLTIDEQGQAVYRPRLGNTAPVTFYEPTGASLMAMDGAGKGKDMTKMFRMMGDACQCDPSRFAKMKQRDLNPCLAVFSLFLTA
jgi:hypothetical protein